MGLVDDREVPECVIAFRSDVRLVVLPTSGMPRLDDDARLVAVADVPSDGSVAPRIGLPPTIQLDSVVARATERADEVVPVVRPVVVVGVDIESVEQLVLPLLNQSGRDEQERVLNLTSVDEPRERESDFDGLPQSDLVAKQEIVWLDGDRRV